MSATTDKIRALSAEGLSKPEIADKCGVSHRYVQHILRGVYSPDGRLGPRNASPGADADELKFLRIRITQLQRAADDDQRQDGALKDFFKSAIAAAGRASPEPKVYKPPKTQSGRVKINSPVAAVAHFTDWHIGAVQKPDEVEGFGEFSLAIAKRRLASYVQAFSKWVEAHRSVYRLDDLHVFVTGDLISGDIHDELRVTNECPSPVQVVEAARLLAWAVNALAPHYISTTVHFVVEDNHARLTSKPQHKEAGLNSLNYLVGMLARERLMDVDGVMFNIYPQFQMVVDVMGRQYLLTHGHKVQGWAGFPYYGLERRAHREAMRRMTTGLGKFHRIVLGHWHAPLCHPYYWIGGSLSGTDAYDHSAARYSAPSQAAWMVHPKHGDFDRTDFDLK
jgi:hypothetical protein